MRLQGSRSRALPQRRYTSLHKSKSVVDFFENQNPFSVPEPWLHSAIPNMHHTNVLQYNTNSALISIDMLSSYMCTNSMQDFLPGTYSPYQTESITGLGSTKQDTTGIYCQMKMNTKQSQEVKAHCEQHFREHGILPGGIQQQFHHSQ
jgi:hypothetical protein